MNDTSRLVAASSDSEFTLSIDEALELYSRAGHPRTPRSIQRYCAKGHLACRLIETPFSEKYLITPDSVAKHIAYIEEVTPTTVRDLSRHVTISRDTAIHERSEQTPPATSNELPRPVAPSPDMSRYVVRLEGENEFLRGQIGVKDTQIKELTERARETNVLIAGLQTMLTPLLGRQDHRDDLAGRVGNEVNREATPNS